MEWAVRSVAASGEFLEPLASSGQENLARLATQLGSDALESTWEIVTGNPLPQAVRERLGSDPVANAFWYANETRPAAQLPYKENGWISPLIIRGTYVSR
jgi:hypothetical protein